jgi:hypothetical protein
MDLIAFLVLPMRFPESTKKEYLAQRRGDAKRIRNALISAYQRLCALLIFGCGKSHAEQSLRNRLGPDFKVHQ